LSIIFIDDIERIIEFSPVGMRFSNVILQTLLVLLRRVPPKPPVIQGLDQPDPRLLIIGTTAVGDLLENLQLNSSFNVVQHVSQLQSPDEIYYVLKKYAPQLSDSDMKDISKSINKPISIKQLLMVLEMAKADDSNISVEQFQECLITVGF